MPSLNVYPNALSMLISAKTSTGKWSIKYIRAFKIIPLLEGNVNHKTNFGETGPPGVSTVFDRLLRLINVLKYFCAHAVETQAAFAPGSANTFILITLLFCVRIGTFMYHLSVVCGTIISLLSLSSATICSTSSS